jgi:hypothetical protein
MDVQIQGMTKLYEFRQLQKNPYLRLGNEDYSGTIKEIGKMAQKATYTLKRLVAPHLTHLELKPFSKEEIEIHEKQHVFLKIFVTDRVAPARVFINYGDDFYVKPHCGKNQKSNMEAIIAYKFNERQGKKT